MLKLDRQEVAAQSQLSDRDDQDEDAAWFEPAVGVLEEERFKSLTRAVAVGGDIVGRVDERAREGLNLAFHVKAVAVNDLIKPLFSLFRPISVQLDAAALAASPVGDHGERLAFTSTRVKYCEVRGGENDVLPDAAGFRLGQRRSSSTSITKPWKTSAKSIWFSMSSAATSGSGLRA